MLRSGVDDMFFVSQGAIQHPSDDLSNLGLNIRMFISRSCSLIVFAFFDSNILLKDETALGGLRIT